MTKLGIIPDWRTPDNVEDSGLSASLELSQNDLHLWLIPLKLSPQQHEIALTLLSDAQRDKYYRRATPELQEQYLAGRYFLFELLAGYLNCQPEDILLSYTRLNKPYLNPNPNNVQFNFTDTQVGQQGYGVFSFCLNHDLGVDIEALGRQTDFKNILAKRFSLKEQKQVTNADGTIHQRKCIAFWTRKEAFGKALGKGLNYSMRDVDLSDELDSPFRKNLIYYSKDEHEQQKWRLKQVQLNDQLIASVVHKSHEQLKLSCFTL